MAENVEIKARVRDRARLELVVQAVSDTVAETIPQRDVFFCTETGRLKLRWLDPERAYLVYYERSDARGPRSSVYHVSETRDPASLERVLTAALGVRGEVRKIRTLYMAGATRIHLDEVDGLGTYLELEAVLGPDQDRLHGHSSVDTLMRRLGIDAADLVDVAYIDLLEDQSAGG